MSAKPLKKLIIFDRIRKVVREQFCLDNKDITLDLDISKDLGADSLDAVELAMDIEEEFGIEIEDAEIPKIKTIQDIVNLVYKIWGGK
jgi:acyl carrier protein